MTSLLSLLMATFLCSLLGSLLGVVLQRWPGYALLWGYSLAILASALGLGTALLFFSDPQPQHLFFFSVFALTGASFELLLDPLAAFFLLVISVGGLLASLYAIGYSQEYRTRRKNLGLFVAGYHLFFLAMVTVIVANNTYLFLLAWEGMGLSSYFLVTFEHESPQVRKAGLLYLIMTHLGTAFLLGAFHQESLSIFAEGRVYRRGFCRSWVTINGSWASP
jgi:hydrogenase-4 component B